MLWVCLAPLAPPPPLTGRAMAPVAQADAAERAVLLRYWQPGRGLGPIGVSFETGSPPADEASEGTAAELLPKIEALLAEGKGSKGLLLLRRSQLEEDLGRKDDAERDRAASLDALTTELAAEPGAVWLRLALAKTLAAADRADDARKVLIEGLDRDPGAAALLIGLLPLDPKAPDRITPCEKALQTALATDPTNREALCGLATVIGLEVSLRTDPTIDDATRYGQYDHLESKLGLIAAFRRRQEALPGDLLAARDTARAYALVGGMCMGGGEDALLEIATTAGDTQLAEFLRPVPELLGDLTQEPKGDLSSFAALTLYRAAAGDLDALLSTLEQAIAVHPTVPALRVRLAELVLELKGDVPRAEAIAQKAQAECPALTVSATAAWVAFRKGDVEAARSGATALLDELGKPATVTEDGPALYRRALLILAGVAASDGKLDEAASLLDYTTDRVPSPSVTIDRALVLMMSDNKTAARELLGQVAADDYRSVVARQLLELLPAP
jgi:tetratricopeptide (TPR) repeat protein